MTNFGNWRTFSLRSENIKFNSIKNISDVQLWRFSRWWHAPVWIISHTGDNVNEREGLYTLAQLAVWSSRAAGPPTLPRSPRSGHGHCPLSGFPPLLFSSRFLSRSFTHFVSLPRTLFSCAIAPLPPVIGSSTQHTGKLLRRCEAERIEVSPTGEPIRIETRWSRSNELSVRLSYEKM